MPPSVRYFRKEHDTMPSKSTRTSKSSARPSPRRSTSATRKAPANAPARKKSSRGQRNKLPTPAPVATAASHSKQAQLIALLRADAGADLAQLCAVTGWQPHSVRGAISGVLRKRLGLTVVCQADAEGKRRYRIVEAPAP
jgi:hypothetical protein